MRDLDDDDDKYDFHEDGDDNVYDISIMGRHSSTWRRLKMIKDRVRLSFKKSISRTSQMENRKMGKLKMEIRYKDNVDLRADNCQGR